MRWKLTKSPLTGLCNLASIHQCSIHWKPIMTWLWMKLQESYQMLRIYPQNPPTSPSHYLGKLPMWVGSTIHKQVGNVCGYYVGS
jgi:hypothetical protein